MRWLLVPAALRLLNAATELNGGLKFQNKEFPWSCEYYPARSHMYPQDRQKTLAGFDDILCGRS